MNDEIILICFQVNIPSRDLRCQMKEYEDLTSCQEFIESNQTKSIFLITSSLNIPEFLSITSHIHSIFVYPAMHDHYEISKIIGSYTDLDTLQLALNNQLNFIDEQHEYWCFFEPTDRDLSKSASDFLWLQILHDTILCLSSNRSIQSEALNNYLSNINLQNQINRALTNENTVEIYHLRYFLSDLVHCLADNYQTNKTSTTVFYQINLTKHQFDVFRSKQGQFLSFKRFIHLTTEPNLHNLQPDFISILFEIETNQILLDFNTIFRFESIEQINQQQWTIGLTIVNDGSTIKNQYVRDTHVLIENVGLPLLFDR